MENRFWYETFGPYVDDERDDDADPTEIGRQTLLPGRFGVNDDLVRFTGRESKGTLRLAAPAGAKLEIHDKAFCASKQFADEGWCAGTACSNPAELKAARRAVKDWQAWRTRKRREAEQFWPADPRRLAIDAEIQIAEADHAGKQANLRRLQGICNTRTSHWGICR